jgi:hypothetical protein
VWDDTQEYVAGYLRALGLSRRPDWVYGDGPRGVWGDDPGRWFIAHAATPDIRTAARDRFTRYVAALGADPAGVDYGRREGRMVASGKRFKMVRGSGA